MTNVLVVKLFNFGYIIGKPGDAVVAYNHDSEPNNEFMRIINNTMPERVGIELLQYMRQFGGRNKWSAEMTRKFRDDFHRLINNQE